MSEIRFVVINTKDRWKMGWEIDGEDVIDLRDKESINLEISNKGLSVKPESEQGTYVSRIGSTIEGCKWHKLVLDADIPEGTRVEIATAITDEEITDIKELQNSWEDTLINIKSALIEGSRGKNLWLKIGIVTSDPEAKAPVVRRIKVCFPRLTYLRYLPAIYQKDSISRDFLERYLSIFETVLTNSEKAIEDVPRLFDVQATPTEFLPWLSTWLGAVRDENWPEEKWREFLSRAVELYKQRGTREGLSELIKIYTGKYPFVVERALLKCDNEDFEKVLNKLFGGKHSFCVLLKPGQVKTESKLRTVKRIIDSEKPAHTCGGLTVIQPWIRLDWHTYLGMNTTLYKPESEMRLGKAKLPINTILEDEILNTIRE